MLFGTQTTLDLYDFGLCCQRKTGEGGEGIRWHQKKKNHWRHVQCGGATSVWEWSVSRKEIQGTHTWEQTQKPKQK